MPRIRASIDIHAPIEHVYAFCTNPLNMPRIFPRDVTVEVMKEPVQPLQAGAEIVLCFQRGPVSCIWESLVTACEPLFLFEDIQVRGPMKRWLSRHYFEKITEGTRVLHVIDYQFHFGALGRICGLMAVDPILRGIFNHAHRATKEVCEQDWRAQESGAGR